MAATPIVLSFSKLAGLKLKLGWFHLVHTIQAQDLFVAVVKDVEL